MIRLRLAALRGRDDGGFALVFALLVTTMIMMGVATTLTATTPNITASKRSQDVAAALTAAQSGIDDAVAYLTSTPACRSETRICPQALGADSITLNRPGLGTRQTFHWTTNASATSDGYVRVTSVGAEDGVSRTLVADLSLNPSILAYGYYSDYESQTPTFINNYWGPRSIYLSDADTYADIASSYTSGTSAPQTLTWNGAGVNPPAGYSDSVCAQHWYSDGASSPGRGNATNKSAWAESGKLNGKTVYNSGSCDIVFTAGMVENGLTYSRDALLIANGNGNGPVFNAPVYTLWGYAGKNSPAISTTRPWRESDGTGNDPLTASPNKPQIATQDITLPATIGLDGVQTNSCVYYGPTRVKLNGDGTATVTSPATTSAAPGADAACYPSNLTGGVVNYTYNYSAVGAGTIYVKNKNTPSGGTWPRTALTAQSTPAAAGEVFWIPATGGTKTDPSPKTNTSVAPTSGCSSSNRYAGTPGGTCSFTGVATTTDATASTGWTAYSPTTKCNTSLAYTDRQSLECTYSGYTGQAKVPGTGGYGATISAIQTKLGSSNCASLNTRTQPACVVNAVNAALAGVSNLNTGSSRYVAGTVTTGTPVYATTNVDSNRPTSPVSSDPFFTLNPAQRTSVVTPVTVTVNHQTYANSKWGGDVPQFTLTATETAWTFTPASSASYFPAVNDVTQYDTGATSAGAAAGSTGSSQPGDLYVDGVNQGNLSMIAQNNVELTGNITKGAGNDSSSANPVSITAGNDIRNYHPVFCVDRDPTDITNTTAGWCPNDISGVYSGSLLNGDGTFTDEHPAAQYVNVNPVGDRTVDAALFALAGSLRTDNYNRGVWVGNLFVYGGLYQSHRGTNGITFGNGSSTPGRAGTTLNYNYVDLQRAHLQYTPAATYSTNPRVWNVVSISAGS